MDQGWIKSHRQLLDNEFLMYDNTAFIIFVKLLHLVDYKTGSFRTGRYGLSERTNIKPTTAYKALLRLEQQEMVRLTSGKQYTTIQIVNWQKYQMSNNLSNNQMTEVKPVVSDSLSDISVTPEGHLSDTSVTLEQELINQNKELRTNNLVDAKAIDRDVQEVFNCYVTEFNTPTTRLSATRRDKIKARLKDAGKDMLLRAIRATAQSPHHTGDNDRAWKANIDFIIRSYEQVERLSELTTASRLTSYKADW